MAQVENDNILLVAPKPIDDRIGTWVNGSWKLFTSVSEVLADPDVTSYRYPSMTIPIWDDDVNANFEYWFDGGIADADFRLKTTTGIAITKGIMAAGDTILSINWNNEIPNEGVTYHEKHGNPDGVMVQVVIRGIVSPNVYSPALTWGFAFDEDPVSLTIDNRGEAAKYSIFSKQQNTLPPIEGFWDDSENWNDSENWTD